jgi:hypothetical protein
MRDLSPLMNTAMMYNVVDSPVGVVPVTRVDPTKDALVGGTWPASKTGGSWIVAQACARAYDPLAMDGIPLAVQVRWIVSCHWQSWLSNFRDCGQEMGGREGVGRHGHSGPGPWQERLWRCDWGFHKAYSLNIKCQYFLVYWRPDHAEEELVET